MKKPNPKQFYFGLVLAVGSAVWFILELSNWATPIVLIIGLALIVTSRYRLLK